VPTYAGGHRPRQAWPVRVTEPPGGPGQSDLGRQAQW